MDFMGMWSGLAIGLVLWIIVLVWMFVVASRLKDIDNSIQNFHDAVAKAVNEMYKRG